MEENANCNDGVLPDPDGFTTGIGDVHRRIDDAVPPVPGTVFGGVRKGKRGRGAAGKVPVFGLLKRGGRIFVLPVKDTRSDTLIPIIACKFQPDSVVYTDSFRAYDQLDVTDFHHMRINRSKLFADRENHSSSVKRSIIDRS